MGQDLREIKCQPCWHPCCAQPYPTLPYCLTHEAARACISTLPWARSSVSPSGCARNTPSAAGPSWDPRGPQLAPAPTPRPLGGRPVAPLPASPRAPAPPLGPPSPLPGVAPAGLPPCRPLPLAALPASACARLAGGPSLLLPGLLLGFGGRAGRSFFRAATVPEPPPSPPPPLPAAPPGCGCFRSCSGRFCGVLRGGPERAALGSLGRGCRLPSSRPPPGARENVIISPGFSRLAFCALRQAAQSLTLFCRANFTSTVKSIWT